MSGPWTTHFGPRGSEPPALVGRDAQRSAAQYSLGLSESGAPAQPIVFTGLRGMGKTALLRRCIAEAANTNAVIIAIEPSASEPFTSTLRRGIDRASKETASLPRKLRAGFEKIIDALPRASYELPNELGAISLGAPQHETPDLATALEDLNDAARHNGRHLVFAIDDVQSGPIDGLRDVVTFVHATANTQRPAYLLAAGLPGSREHLHKVRTYTERWRYFRLDLLTIDETKTRSRYQCETGASTLHRPRSSDLHWKARVTPIAGIRFCSVARSPRRCDHRG